MHNLPAVNIGCLSKFQGRVHGGHAVYLWAGTLTCPDETRVSRRSGLIWPPTELFQDGIYANKLDEYNAEAGPVIRKCRQTQFSSVSLSVTIQASPVAPSATRWSKVSDA